MSLRGVMKTLILTTPALFNIKYSSNKIRNPSNKNIRRINPVLMPLIEREVKMMYEAQIIAPIRY